MQDQTSPVAGKRMMLMLSLGQALIPTLDFFLHLFNESALGDKNVYLLFTDEESEVQRDTSALKQRNWNLNLLYLALNPRSDPQ